MTGDDLGLRQKDDFYATPAWVTEALLRVEAFYGACWEPAAGTGLVSEVLKAAGHEVVSTDLVDRGYAPALTGIDFLLEQRALAPNVITNPPFKLAKEFAQHALDIGCNKVALLLKLAFMQGGDRSRRTEWLFSGNGFRRLIVIPDRITFVAAPDRPAFTSNFVDGYGWFVWQAGYRGPVEMVSA